MDTLEQVSRDNPRQIQSTPHLAIAQHAVDSNRDTTSTFLKEKGNIEAPPQHIQSEGL